MSVFSLKVAKFAKPLVKVGKAALKKGLKASKRIVKSAATKVVKNGTKLASKIGKALFKKGSKSSAVRHTVKKGLGIVKSTVKKGVGAAKKTVTSKVVKTGKKIVQTFKKSKVGKAANKVAEVHRTVKKKVQQFGDNVYSKLESKLSKESKDLAEAACFVKGTKVLTDTGYRGIETIKVGDRVFAKDVAKQSQGYETVSRVFVHEVHTIVTLVVGKQTIKTTKEHPFYVSGKGWVPAKDLTASDRLINGDNESVKLTSISTETLDQPVKVYNFEVANAHTYYVSSETILVHNDCRQVPKKKASGTKVPDVEITTPLGKNIKKHISKHDYESFKKQANYLTDSQLAQKLNKNSFFNPEWSTSETNKYVEIAYNDLLAQGKTGKHVYEIAGEKITIVIKNDGILDTAFGSHKLTVNEFRK